MHLITTNNGRSAMVLMVHDSDPNAANTCFVAFTLKVGIKQYSLTPPLEKSLTLTPCFRSLCFCLSILLYKVLDFELILLRH